MLFFPNTNHLLITKQGAIGSRTNLSLLLSAVALLPKLSGFATAILAAEISLSDYAVDSHLPEKHLRNHKRAFISFDQAVLRFIKPVASGCLPHGEGSSAGIGGFCVGE
jgi:hypothetical protein